MSDGLEEMGLPPLGHNKPPESTPFERASELVRNCNRWLAERPSIVDAEMAGAAQTFTDQLRAVRDDLGLALKRERRPHDDAIEQIKRRYADPQELVRIALERMQKLNADWLKRERERLEAERVERERQADAAIVQAAQLDHAAQQPGASVETQLAAQRANERAAELTDAATRAPVRPQVRGDYSARAMSLRSNWKGRVVSFNEALAHYADHADFRAGATTLMEQSASRLAKKVKGDQSKAPPGVQFYNDERAQ